MTVYALDGVGVFAGGRELTAPGEGGFIEISRTAELWENTAMADGQIVSARNLDKSATVTLTFRYDSPSNQILQRFAAAGSTITFSVTWPNGDTFDSNEARVQKYPDISDAMSPGDRQWTIFLTNAEYSFAVGA